MVWENFGEHTGQTRGPQPLPPGFPTGLWIDVTPAPPPGPPSSPPMAQPPPTPPTSAPPPPEPEPSLPELAGFDIEPDAPGRDPRYESPPEFEGRPPGSGWPQLGSWIPWQPTEPRTRPGEIPWPDDRMSPPSTIPDSAAERARRRQGARERDAIIREAAERSRIDSRVRRGRGVIEGVVQRGVPRILSRIFGPIGGVLFPEPLGSGEVSPEEMARREAEVIERRLDELEQLAREVFDPYRGRQLGPEIAPLPGPPDPVISAPWPTPPTSSPSPSPPQPSTAPRPRPTTTTGPSPGTIPSGAPAPFSVPWLLPSLTTIGLTSLPTSGSRLTPSAPSAPPAPSVTADPLSPPWPSPGTDPLSPPGASSPLTRFETLSLSSAPPTTRTRTRQRECECKPKKRKKRRECTTRGTLMWTSGPKKGKSAGSRCIKFKETR